MKINSIYNIDLLDHILYHLPICMVLSFCNIPRLLTEFYYDFN